jgi:transposase-like protein
VDEMGLSLSAMGLTHGEISAHLAEVYGAEVSKQTISTIIGQAMEGMAEWQTRPLDRSPSSRTVSCRFSLFLP